MAEHVRKIVRMGQSRGLTLPPEICRAVGIDIGSEVTVTEQDGQVLVTRVKAQRESLAQRLARSDIDNVRSSGKRLADAKSVGRER